MFISTGPDLLSIARSNPVPSGIFYFRWGECGRVLFEECKVILSEKCDRPEKILGLEGVVAR